MRSPRIVVALALLIALAVAHSSALGETAVFNINSGSSSLMLNGTAVQTAILQQTSGSLLTSFTGSITTDLTASTIAFTSASADANLQPQNQQPEAGGLPGTDPADYGFAFGPNGVGAVRNLLLNIASSPINVAGGSFASTQAFSISDGALDYASGVLFGGLDLTGDTTGNLAVNGTLQTVGITQILTVPVNISFNESILTADDTQLTLTGTLVATRLVPEPSSLLVATAAAGLLSRRRVR